VGFHSPSLLIIRYGACISFSCSRLNNAYASPGVSNRPEMRTVDAACVGKGESVKGCQQVIKLAGRIKVRESLEHFIPLNAELNPFCKSQLAELIFFVGGASKFCA
jgi:hypothetical protein